MNHKKTRTPIISNRLDTFQIKFNSLDKKNIFTKLSVDPFIEDEFNNKIKSINIKINKISNNIIEGKVFNLLAKPKITRKVEETFTFIDREQIERQKFMRERINKITMIKDDIGKNIFNGVEIKSKLEKFFSKNKSKNIFNFEMPKNSSNKNISLEEIKEFAENDESNLNINPEDKNKDKINFKSFKSSADGFEKDNNFKWNSVKKSKKNLTKVKIINTRDLFNKNKDDEDYNSSYNYENNNENNFETSKLKNFENKFPMYKLNDNRGIFKFEKTFDNPTRSIKQEQEELDAIRTYLSR